MVMPTLMWGAAGAHGSDGMTTPDGVANTNVGCRYTLPQDLAAPLQAAVKGSLEKALSVLVQMHAALCDAEDKADAIVLSRGALTEAMQAKLASKMEQCALLVLCSPACAAPAAHAAQRSGVGPQPAASEHSLLADMQCVAGPATATVHALPAEEPPARLLRAFRCSGT